VGVNISSSPSPLPSPARGEEVYFLRNSNDRNSSSSFFGHSKLEFGAYLKFGICDLGFHHKTPVPPVTKLQASLNPIRSGALPGTYSNFLFLLPLFYPFFIRHRHPFFQYRIKHSQKCRTHERAKQIEWVASLTIIALLLAQPLQGLWHRLLCCQQIRIQQ
jgi:hypothetical protein